MAQIKPIVSEALEAQIRALLPSQNGFTEDLQAQNVIVPVIDLTSAAEGSATAQNLQTALAFGSQTSFAANNSTDVIANSPGFYRIIGTAHITSDNSVDVSNSFTMTDGLSVKTVYKQEVYRSSRGNSDWNFDFIVFLGAGESISAVSSNALSFINGSSRQIATVNGDLVNPSGFSPQ